MKKIDTSLTNHLVLIKQIVLFLFLGMICYLVDILLLVGFVELLGMEENLANLIASVISIYVAYILNAKYVFEKGSRGTTYEVTSFFIFSFLGLIFNVILFKLFITYIPISYIISKTIVTALEAVFNFATRKFYVFK